MTWKPIMTAPKHKNILVAGRLLCGTPYVATGFQCERVLGFGKWEIDLGLSTATAKPCAPNWWMELPEHPGEAEGSAQSRGVA